MNTNIFLIKLSPQLEDGSRKIISETVVATCKEPGNANLIVSLLRNQDSFKKLLSIDSPNSNKYLLNAEKRKPMKL